MHSKIDPAKQNQASASRQQNTATGKASGNQAVQRLQAMPDNSKSTTQLRALRSIADNSPKTLQLKALQDLATYGPHGQKTAQLQKLADNHSSPAQMLAQKNNTGVPDKLKSGIEGISGISMDDVKVHYNSNKPAQLQAHAYAQGTDIHIAPGQEKHLPHEAWHVVQQKQGRVKPTVQKKGIGINDNATLEKEADVMGAKAAMGSNQAKDLSTNAETPESSPIQRRPTIKSGPLTVQCIKWVDAKSSPSGLSKALEDGYQLAKSKPTSKPEMPSWVMDRVIIESPYDGTLAETTAQNDLDDLWNNLSDEAKGKINKVDWMKSQKTKKLNQSKKSYEQSIKNKAANRWRGAKWNESFDNKDNDLPDGDYKEYYAEPTGDILVEKFYGKNRILRECKMNTWWATSDHYINFTKIEE